MLKKFVHIVGGDPNKKEIEKYSNIVAQINALELEYEGLSNDALKAKTEEFKTQLNEGQTLDDLLIEAFAAVREASKRTIGLRHYDIQLVGGIALHEGKIAEMKTGEGKTLVATLPLYLNALTGRGVHLVTVNDYLARRDARWMAPIYNLLGLSVGVLQMAARTESGRKAFLVNLERESPHEDQHQLDMVSRRLAYEADITYGTNSEFGFDYLRDNMTMRLQDRVQREFYYAIVDEVDNVLIDEARTPLIISGPAQDEAEWYINTSQVVKKLNPEDYEVNEKDRAVFLTEIGETHVEELLGVSLRDPDRPEDITPEQARLLGYLEQSLRAQFLYKRNKEYLVQGGKVVIVDEFTGRLMPGRRWSDGLHQAVEAKEGVKVQSESVTYATITIQNYFRMYEKLSGMTGTAVTEAEEFNEIYSLDVIAIPTNLEFQASRPDSELVELEDRDEQGYKYFYYSNREDEMGKAIFWKRKDYPDVVYRTEEAKLRAIATEILKFNSLGRPVLVGTTSVEFSERVSNRLKAEQLRRLAQVIILRESWMKDHQREQDGRIVPELEFLNLPLKELDINQMRTLARESNISFNPEDQSNIELLMEILEIPPDKKERLLNNIKGGISHQVLNARKHTEESQIIAGAGEFGGVTIATNMAGRGVDIKLGGEIAEEVISSVNRVLKRADFNNAFDMTMAERKATLLQLDPSQYGIYDSEIKFFLRHMEEMDQVRDLGGLHVIGSERHEARRIDNQLRGRAARQGDPGSSRFYLSMEDELMRLFGGQQADSLMQRMKIDDAIPLEVGLVGRLVEQSQNRVEGANFDVRKHLLEYDDVLNTQRARIYSQRNRIFTKSDLTEDVTEMLAVEVKKRVSQGLENESGPWQLLSWLDQIQPPIMLDNLMFPSYSLKLLADKTLDSLSENASSEDIRNYFMSLVEDSIDSEMEHLIQTVDQILLQTQLNIENTLDERYELLDTFLEGQVDWEEGEASSPGELLSELSSLVRVQLNLSGKDQRILIEDPFQIEDTLKDQIESTIVHQGLRRLIGSIERRIDEPVSIKPDQLPSDDWDTINQQVLSEIERIFNARKERYLGGNGQVAKDLENALSKFQENYTRQDLLQVLLALPRGAKASFDRKTHKRVWERTTRFNYFYYTAELLLNREKEQVIKDVLEHLNNTQGFMRKIWGQFEYRGLESKTIEELPDDLKNTIIEITGREDEPIFQATAIKNLPEEFRVQIIDEFGRKSLTEIYRQLLLTTISELWVEYLTQMEALRVSIGLEAYAQRDPLVQYKNKAYGLFQDLLDNMRLSVISRMFTYRPRSISRLQKSPDASDSTQSEDIYDAEFSVDEELDSPSETISAPAEISASQLNTNNQLPQEEEISVSSKRRRRRRKKKK
jgi:preprotein translocase subunit SecA